MAQKPVNVIGQKDAQFGIVKVKQVKLNPRSTRVQWRGELNADAGEIGKVGEGDLSGEEPLELGLHILTVEHAFGDL